MVISQLLIKNFQSYKKTLIEFCDGMNVIYGNSDNGKSSIIRAIKWIVTNRPTGDEFIRHGAKGASVGVRNKKATIERIKSGSKNQYKLNGKVFKALRTAVPEEISSILNLSEENIQSQHEVYFLVDKSPGQRSKKLNEIAGLEIMDKVIKNTNTKIRETNTEIRALNISLENVDNKLLDLEWVDGADKFLAKLEDLEDKIGLMENTHDELTIIVTTLEILERDKSKFLSDECVKEINHLANLRNKIQQQESKWSSLQSKVTRIIALQKQRKEIRVVNITMLLKQQDMIENEENRLELLQSIISEIKVEKSKHMMIEKSIEGSERRINEELKRKGVCPVCKQVIK